MVDFRNRVDRVLKHCTTTFGEEVRLFPKAGGTYSIRAIFDNEIITIDPDTEQPVSGNQPALGINLNDLPDGLEIKEGDVFKVRNIKFRVIDNKEDGQGGTTVLLHRVNDKQKVYKRPLG